MKIRLKKSTELSLEFLAESTGITNKSEIIERCVNAWAILGKLKKEDPLYSLLLYSTELYRNAVSIEQCCRDTTVLYSYTTVYKKKKGEIFPLSSKKEESYQQSVILHDRVKDLLPYGPNFESWWIRWRNHLRDTFGQHPTRQTELAQIKKLNDLQDEKRAIATIQNSITNGYKGLFPDKLPGKKGTTFSADKARTAFDKGWESDS